MKRLQVNISHTTTHTTTATETTGTPRFHSSGGLFEAAKTAVKHMKTADLIERIALFEMEKNYIFPPSEIVRAFMETNCFLFSRPDVDFIKTCLKSKALQTSEKAWKAYAAEKKTEAVKEELKIYHALRNEIKSGFKGLLYYKEIREGKQ